MTDLFSYSEAWSCPQKRAQLFRHLRLTYLLKGLILLPFLPFDIAYLFFTRLFDGKAEPGYVFTSSKALDQCFEGGRNKSTKLFLISDPFTAIRRRGQLIKYIPASPIYIMCALVPWKGRFRKFSNNFINRFTVFLLEQLFRPGKIIFVMHSDALPFVRALLFATINNPKIQSVNVCIQHGIFHDHFECSELDGLLADINVTRSQFDKRLIERSNKNCLFIISEDFFLPSVTESQNHKDVSVILVGEGFHVVDKLLSEKYISRLKCIESQLIKLDWQVKYRPHPSEKLIYRSFGFEAIDSSKLKDSLASAIAYIGYSSTLLIEASSIGVPCYAITIDGEAQVNFQRSSGAIKIMDYDISTFSPVSKQLDSMLNANIRRKLAQKEVFLRIKEACCG